MSNLDPNIKAVEDVVKTDEKIENKTEIKQEDIPPMKEDYIQTMINKIIKQGNDISNITKVEDIPILQKIVKQGNENETFTKIEDIPILKKIIK